jgi:predicted nicotinamide N-methyase
MVEVNSRDIFGIIVRNNSHNDMRKLRQVEGAATIHGNKLWKSSSLLIDYLQLNPPPQNARILEVGCGWGISGIYCAKYFQAAVVASDADSSVLPYVNYHAQLNGAVIDTVRLPYEKITKAFLSQFDMVIGSDICFWDEMTDPLTKLIRRCYLAGVQRVVLTDPGRQPFRDMAAHCVEAYAALYENWSVPHPYNVSGLVLDIH